jgi:Zn-finger nucleic acid-binding protein
MPAPPAATYPTRPAEYRPQGDLDKDRYERERYDKDRYEKDEYRYKKKKREGFLGELFDF